MDQRPPATRPDDYELIDWGDGRKLERFGQLVLDRPCPAAEGLAQGNPQAWRRATARFERWPGESGRWTPAADVWSPWTIESGGLSLELRGTDFGHVGFFPEHRATWDWIGDFARSSTRPFKLLNIFAYTGGASLAAAGAGAEVVHVDAARTTVGWARRNAELSGLAEAPVRWIVDDAVKYCRREVRRGVCYDAIVLDPPSYGHGPAGRPWTIERHLPALLETCAALRSETAGLVLLTCHTPGYDGDTLAGLLAKHRLAPRRADVRRGELVLSTADGRALSSGSFALWNKDV